MTIIFRALKQKYVDKKTNLTPPFSLTNRICWIKCNFPGRGSDPLWLPQNIQNIDQIYLEPIFAIFSIMDHHICLYFIFKLTGDFASCLKIIFFGQYFLSPIFSIKKIIKFLWLLIKNRCFQKLLTRLCFPKGHGSDTFAIIKTRTIYTVTY